MVSSAQEIYLTVVTVSALILLLAIVFILAIFRYQNSLKRIHDLKAQYDQEILRSQIEVQNATLQYLGKELHDNVGQLLSVARINLNIVEETAKEPENENFVKQANELVEQSIQELRALSKSLDSDFVQDFGFQEMMIHELERIKKTNKFHTEITIQGQKHSLGYDREIVLFRITQEILNNALKHSGATIITVILDYLPNNITLQISDNGKGFNYSAAIKNELSLSGSGLRNIKRRAALINFNCEISSEIFKGTCYILTTSRQNASASLKD
jgi:two-component system, NarL family, sensor kinase